MLSSNGEIKAEQGSFIFKNAQNALLLSQSQKWLLRSNTPYNWLILDYVTADNEVLSTRIYSTENGWVCSDDEPPANQFSISSAGSVAIKQLFEDIEELHLKKLQQRLTRSNMLQPTAVQMDNSAQFSNYSSMLLIQPPHYKLKIIPEAKSTGPLTQLAFEILNSAYFSQFNFKWNENNHLVFQFQRKPSNKEHPLISYFKVPENEIINSQPADKDSFSITMDDSATYECKTINLDVIRLLADLDNVNFTRLKAVIDITEKVSKEMAETTFHDVVNSISSDPILLNLLGEKFYQLGMHDYAKQSYEAISSVKTKRTLKNDELAYYDNAQYRLGQLALAEGQGNILAKTNAIICWSKAGFQGSKAIAEILLGAQQAEQKIIDLQKENMRSQAEIAALKQQIATQALINRTHSGLSIVGAPLQECINLGSGNSTLAVQSTESLLDKITKHM